jgi:hypothetical protein
MEIVDQNLIVHLDYADEGSHRISILASLPDYPTVDSITFNIIMKVMDQLGSDIGNTTTNDSEPL